MAAAPPHHERRPHLTDNRPPATRPHTGRDVRERLTRRPGGQVRARHAWAVDGATLEDHGRE